jgi:hypothetical protein
MKLSAHSVALSLIYQSLLFSFCPKCYWSIFEEVLSSPDRIFSPAFPKKELCSFMVFKRWYCGPFTSLPAVKGSHSPAHL